MTLWERDPDHHPEVIKAIQDGMSTEELTALRQRIADEYTEEFKRRRDPILWETRNGFAAEANKDG